MLDVQGTLQTDEKVEFKFTETIGGVTYYVGFLSQLSDSGLANATQTTQQANTAASKAGTRYTVLLAGVPSTNEVVVLTEEGGKCLSTSQTALYFCYYGHGEYNRTPKKYIRYDGNLENGTTADWIIDPILHNFTVSRMVWRTNESTGMLPNADVTLYLNTGIGNTGTSRTLSLGTVSNSARQGYITLSSPLMFTTGDYFCIYGNGKGIGKLILEFF